MSRKTVSYTFDTLPPLTEKQRRDLEALAVQPDDTIDLTDIPELTEAQLAEMRPAAHYRPVKKQITARVAALWSGRQDRYSQLRGQATPDTPDIPQGRIEMSYIGG